jgi:hypothetical protein
MQQELWLGGVAGSEKEAEGERVCVCVVFVGCDVARSLAPCLPGNADGHAAAQTGFCLSCSIPSGGVQTGQRRLP